MNIKNNLKSCFTLLLALAACSKSNNTKPVKSQATDVYAVGFSTTRYGVSVATYWKNGIPTLLADSNISSRANGIVVVNNNIYIAGTITDPTYGSPIAVYWNNGVETRLTDHLVNSYANSIAVSGSDIYVAGYNTGAGGVTYGTAEYWKNGVPTLLTAGTTQSIAWSITVSGIDVYVSGTENFSGLVYWKNGVIMPFTNGITYGRPSGIFLNGSDIYVVNGQNYWKNGVNTTLTVPSSTLPLASAITVSGSDVYVGGTDFPTSQQTSATYWKNNIAFSIARDVTSSGALAIAVSGTDVYLAGYVSNSFDTSNVDGKAAYWKNGTLTKLSNSFSEIDGIVVISY